MIGKTITVTYIADSQLFDLSKARKWIVPAAVFRSFEPSYSRHAIGRWFNYSTAPVKVKVTFYGTDVGEVGVQLRGPEIPAYTWLTLTKQTANTKTFEIEVPPNDDLLPVVIADAVNCTGFAVEKPIPMWVYAVSILTIVGLAYLILKKG